MNTPSSPSNSPFLSPEGLRWGVIIVTGLAAALVVILGGLLVDQVGKALNASFTDPTATPSPLPIIANPVQSPPVLALQIPHQGVWRMERWIQTPSGDVYHWVDEGVGAIPPMPAPPTGIRQTLTLTFQINVFIPEIESGQGRLEIFQQPTTYRDYLAAVDGLYYALYDADNQFLSVVSANEFPPTGIRIEVWSP